jgi:hypothetical protein
MPSALSEGNLNSCYTTKLDIVKSTQEVFRANLPISHSKGHLVLAYKNLIAAKGMPTDKTTTTDARPTMHPNNQNCVTTEWNIHRQQGMGAIEFTKPFNGDAYTLIQAIETRI